MASSARLRLQPLRPCCDPKPETISASTCASNAPAQPRRAHVPRDATPHLTPAGGCSGWLATTRNHVRSHDRRRWHLEQPSNRWPRQDQERAYAEYRTVRHTETTEASDYHAKGSRPVVLQ